MSPVPVSGLRTGFSDCFSESTPLLFRFLRTVFLGLVTFFARFRFAVS